MICFSRDLEICEVIRKKKHNKLLQSGFECDQRGVSLPLLEGVCHQLTACLAPAALNQLRLRQWLQVSFVRRINEVVFQCTKHADRCDNPFIKFLLYSGLSFFLSFFPLFTQAIRIMVPAAEADNLVAGSVRSHSVSCQTLSCYSGEAGLPQLR